MMKKMKIHLKKRKLVLEDIKILINGKKKIMFHKIKKYLF